MKFVLPIVVTATLLLAACGQKGPLYLPEPTAVMNNDAPDAKDAPQTISAEVSEDALANPTRESADE